MITILEITDLTLKGRDLDIKDIDCTHVQSKEVVNKSSLVLLKKADKVKELKYIHSTTEERPIFPSRDLTFKLASYMNNSSKRDFIQNTENLDEEIVEHFIKHQIGRDLSILEGFNDEDDYGLYE